MMQKQKMEVITFSSRELKIVEGLDIHNLISYDKFMEGKTAPFKRIITSTLINDMIVKYRSVFDRIDIIGYVSTDLSTKLKALAEYRTNNYVSANDDLKKAMLEVAQEHNCRLWPRRPPRDHLPGCGHVAHPTAAAALRAGRGGGDRRSLEGTACGPCGSQRARPGGSGDGRCPLIPPPPTPGIPAGEP